MKKIDGRNTQIILSQNFKVKRNFIFSNRKKKKLFKISYSPFKTKISEIPNIFS